MRHEVVDGTRFGRLPQLGSRALKARKRTALDHSANGNQKTPGKRMLSRAAPIGLSGAETVLRISIAGGCASENVHASSVPSSDPMNIVTCSSPPSNRHEPWV